MFKSLSKIVVSACVAAAMLTSCSKKYSPDTVPTPTYNPSIVISSDNGVLYGLDPSNGAKNWELALPGPIFASPMVYNDIVYVGVNGLVGAWDTLYKINGKTGALIKKMTIPTNFSYSIKATPLADGKSILLATTNDSLYSIDTGTAAVNWRFGESAGSFVASPTVSGGKVYVASTSGNVYCLNDADGSQVWQYTTPSTGASFYSSPAIGDSFLFVGCTDSSMYCLYLTSFGTVTAGTLKWTYKTNGPVTSSPAAYYGNCVFGSNDFKVYCIDVMSGNKKWSFNTTSNINYSSPYVHDQVAYIGSNDYNLYALNMIDGSQKWKFTSNGLIASSPLLYNGMVYIGSFDANFYAVDSATGTLKWSHNVGGQIECSPAVDNFTGTQINSQISGATN